jgi:propanediol dehydratase small subunit
MTNMETSSKYPFYQKAKDWLRLPGGRPLEALSLEAVMEGAVGTEEIGIHPETLRLQAQVAREAGFRQVAANLRRAAELAAIPDEKVLSFYEALRPGRSSPERLEAISRELEEVWHAPLTAAFVREALMGLGPAPPGRESDDGG